MLETLLLPAFGDIKFRILRMLDEQSLLACRRVSRHVKEAIDSECQFTLRLSDKKLHSSSRSLSLPISKTCMEGYNLLDRISITKLEVGKMISNKINLPALGISWDYIEEVSFTSVVTPKNFYAVLNACPSTRVLRTNYLVLGANKKTGKILKRLGINKKHDHVDSSCYLPYLEAIYVDRDLNTKDFLNNRRSAQFKYFDPDLYFKTLYKLLDSLEKDVQKSIPELLETQMICSGSDTKERGLFFVKSHVLNRFPMGTKALNSYYQILKRK